MRYRFSAAGIALACLLGLSVAPTQAETFACADGSTAASSGLCPSAVSQYLDNTGKAQSVDASHPLPVDASVSATATIASLAPTGNAVLAVTTSSARVALGSADGSALINNTGAVTVYVKFGSVAVTAATTDTPILAGQTVNLSAGVNAYIAAITASGSSNITITTGTGLASIANSGAAGTTQGVNISQVNAATVNVGAGAASTGTQRVTTSTDSTIATITNPVGVKGADGSAIASVTNPVPVAPASVSTTDKAGTLTSGGTAQNAIASNASRKGWCIMNDPLASETLYVRANGTASATTGIPLGAGVQACSSPSLIDTAAISVYAATTSHRWYGFEVQ
jgi:hypothetical protein